MTMETTTTEAIVGHLKELRFKHWGMKLKEDLEQMNPKERDIILPHLSRWLVGEKTERKTAQINAKIRGAKFRRLQTVETYNFRYSKEIEKIEKPYLELYNSIAREDLPSAVLSGTAGTGKTHLARALGYGACQKGISVLFISAAEMVNHLAHAQKISALEQELNRYRRPQVLIIDELGYVSLDTQASNLFFQVISARHDQKLGTIATTNIAFGKFNQIFANDAIAHAIVDRLVNEAEVFYMEGPSYREHQRKEKMKRRKNEE
jgi:DNA replication protein DnaC